MSAAPPRRYASTNRVRGASVLALAALVLLTGAPAGAQHDGHAAASGSRGSPSATGRIVGTVQFANSGADAAQAPFLEGIALLHNFHYDEAASDFRRAQAADPAFALPYWAEALTYSHALWGEEALDSARAALARLAPTPDQRLARARTPDERAFGAMVEAYFAPGPLPARARAYAAAGRRWASANPGHPEAAVFTALAVMTEGYTTPGPAGDSLLAEAAGYAQPIFAANPRHPGAAHYLIHAWDRPATAARGLAAARAYDGIAPDAEHALHMPSHIYYQLGMWPEMARSNERAWPASRAPGRDGTPGGGSPHSLEWLQYAYLQQGRLPEARALIDTARRLYPAGQFDPAVDPDAAHAPTFLAFRYGADTGDWSAWPRTVDSAGAHADQVQGPNGAPPSSRALTMGVVRAYHEAVGALLARGDTAPAIALSHRMASQGDAMQASDPRTAARMRGRVAQLEGLVAERRGDRAGAIAAYTRASATAGAGGPSIPNVLDPRELLAAAQLAAGDARAALASYDAALRTSPNRTSLVRGQARARAMLDGAHAPGS